MKCRQGRRGCEGHSRLPGPLINWPLESIGFIWIAARWRRGSRVSYQKAAQLRAFVCWVINLAVSELSLEVSFCLVLTLLSLHRDRPGLRVQRKGLPGSVRLPPIRHSSNHLIRAVFDDECAEWRWTPERPTGWLICTSS